MSKKINKNFEQNCAWWTKKKINNNFFSTFLSWEHTSLSVEGTFFFKIFSYEHTNDETIIRKRLRWIDSRTENYIRKTDRKTHVYHSTYRMQLKHFTVKSSNNKNKTRTQQLPILRRSSKPTKHMCTTEYKCLYFTLRWAKESESRIKWNMENWEEFVLKEKNIESGEDGDRETIFTGWCLSENDVLSGISMNELKCRRRNW